MRGLAGRSMRYVDQLADRSKALLSHGLRARMGEGYTRQDLRADLLAALVVGVVTLPLSMALAIACGLPPQHGLYTAIVAGVICSLLGGTRFQITGVTAAVCVILLPVVKAHGLAGALVAGLLAGTILVLMGLARLGRLVQLVPHPVITGFSMGIAVAISINSLGNLLGLHACTPELTASSGPLALAATACLAKSTSTLDYLGSIWDARGAIEVSDLTVAVVTLGLIIGLPNVLRRVPIVAVVMVVVSIGVAVVAKVVPNFTIATVGSEFTATVGGELVRGIPPLPPLPMVPWHATAGFALDYATIRDLLPPAFAIAMFGAIESLRAAVVADGMSGTRHDPDAELVALGIANLACPLFGGVAATGALARTATNIRAGARSPIAGAAQAVFVLACTIGLAPLVRYIPIGALAALVLAIAIEMAEARHFLRLVRVAPRHDVVVMLVCFGLVVGFDMAIAVTVGVVLAALVLMRRMAVLARIELEPPAAPARVAIQAPRGVRLYDISGPLFFGAARTAMEALHTVGDPDHTYVINMKHVPTMDATSLVALESVLDRLHRSSIKVIFAGVVPEVADIFERSGIKRMPGRIAYAPDIDTALSMAIVHASRTSRFTKAA
ncbi:MAG: SulP family inorganic anion transporter [Proteobacteria bacterium]|nr:SulP family inorganic anion transporter [Pseudomonadota bacterium]